MEIKKIVKEYYEINLFGSDRININKANDLFNEVAISVIPESYGNGQGAWEFINGHKSEHCDFEGDLDKIIFYYDNECEYCRNFLKEFLTKLGIKPNSDILDSDCDFIQIVG